MKVEIDIRRELGRSFAPCAIFSAVFLVVFSHFFCGFGSYISTMSIFSVSIVAMSTRAVEGAKGYVALFISSSIVHAFICAIVDVDINGAPYTALTPLFFADALFQLYMLKILCRFLDGVELLF